MNLVVILMFFVSPTEVSCAEDTTVDGVEQAFLNKLLSA